MRSIATGFKVFTTTLALGLVALATMAGSLPAYASDTPVMDRIKKSGVLRIGTTGNQPPFSVKSKSGEIIGMDIDLARALAMSMGVKAELVVMDFAKLLDAVEKGSVDIALSGLTMTPERNTRVAFAGPYFSSGKGLVTTSAALSNVDDPSDIDTGEFTLVALDGSTSLDFIKSAAPTAKAVAAKDYDTAVQMVIDGKADAMIADFPICLITLFQHPGKGLQGAVSPFTFEPLGAALPGNDALFMNLVNNYVDMLEDTGLMTELRAKWFEDGAWLDQLP